MKIFTQLLQIITLQRRPSDISFDQSAAMIAFIGAVSTGYFQMVASSVIDQPLPFVATQSIALAAIFYALLTFRGVKNRLIQTLTALFGVATILQFIGLIIMQLPALVVVGIVVNAWNFYLMILILKEAIDCSIFQSILLTIAYHFVIGLILLMLFPEIYAQVQEAVKTSSGA